MEWGCREEKRWRVRDKNKTLEEEYIFLNIRIKIFIINMKNTAVTGIGSDSAFHPGSLFTLAA